jgi:hypothetical protein
MNELSSSHRQGAKHKLRAILGPIVLAIVCGILTIELGLRKFYQLIPLDVCARDGLISAYVCQPYFQYETPIRIGYRYEPGFRMEGIWDPADPHLANAAGSTAPSDRSDAFQYRFETDEMGFPNSEYEWRDQYDIIVTGDSFTIRTAPETWIEALGRLTGKSILTLGAPSWSTLNEAEAIKMYGLDKEPEWIILLYFEGNDLLNTSQYLERQHSGLNWKEYDLQDAPLSSRLLTPHMLGYFFDRLFSPEEMGLEYRYPVAASTNVGEIETVLKDVHLLPMSADYETLAASREFDAVGQALIAIDDKVRSQGARFLLVYVPSKEHVLWSRIWDPVDLEHVLQRTVTVRNEPGPGGTLVWEPQYLSYETFNQNHNAQEKLLEEFARQNEIEFLNLTPLFWLESIERGELYHYADPHWNQAGNHLAAEAIREYMETR